MGYAAEHRSADALRRHRYSLHTRSGLRDVTGVRKSMRSVPLRRAAARSVRRGRAVLAAALSAVLRRM